MPNARSGLISFASLIWLLAAGVPADAQNPKQGEDNITHTYTYVDKVMKMGDRTTIFFASGRADIAVQLRAGVHRQRAVQPGTSLALPAP